MKQTLLMAAMALSAGALLAQAEPGGQDGPLTPITASVADSETDAQTDIEAFLKDKARNGKGDNIKPGVNKKDDGSVFVISTGIGIVAAPITHPSFGASRARAFDRRHHRRASGLLHRGVCPPGARRDRRRGHLAGHPHRLVHRRRRGPGRSGPRAAPRLQRSDTILR